MRQRFCQKKLKKKTNKEQTNLKTPCTTSYDKNEKRQFIKEKRRKKKEKKKTSDTCYSVFYELIFFPLLPKGKRLDSKSDMEFF